MEITGCCLVPGGVNWAGRFISRRFQFKSDSCKSGLTLFDQVSREKEPEDEQVCNSRTVRRAAFVSGHAIGLCDCC
jgi:hypothetical protein